MNSGTVTELPGLRLFMSCYWMETADLIYGNLTGATRAFLDLEPRPLARSLLGDLEIVRAAGYLVPRPAPESKVERFWQQFGARWLSEEDAELVALLIRRENVQD